MAGGLVTTREAAKLYGCVTETVVRAMRGAGIKPEVTRVALKHGGSCRAYLWNPAEVLRVRAERKLREAERKLAFAAYVWGNTNTAKGSRALARTTRLETERRKILQRVADRKGITVSQLTIDTGLPERYARGTSKETR